MKGRFLLKAVALGAVLGAVVLALAVAPKSPLRHLRIRPITNGIRLRMRARPTPPKAEPAKPTRRRRAKTSARPKRPKT
jgi:hypothetical protein